MEYRFLGDTGVKVSALCMGTMTFGNEANKAESGAIFNRCRDAGINFFDCANVYSDGRAEEILGRLIADEGFRRSYQEDGKLGWHMMDMSRLADDYLNMPITLVALLYLLATLALPIVVWVIATRGEGIVERCWSWLVG